MKLRQVAGWVVLLGGVLPCTAAAQAEGASSAEEAALMAPAHPLATGAGAEVNRALRLARDRAVQASTIVDALVRVGPASIGPVLIALEERKLPELDGGAVQVLSDAQEARCLDALRKLDAGLVWAAVDARLVVPEGEVPALSARVAAVLAAGTCADATEIGRLLACARCDPAQELEEALDRALRMASEDLFRRKPEALTRLAETWRKLPGVFLPALVRGAGAGGDPLALRFLEQALAQPGDLEKLALAQLTLQRAPATATLDLFDDLRRRLDASNPAICQAACNAIGALGGFVGAEELIALMSSESEGVRANAYRALCTMSGLGLPAQASSWQAWRLHESAWYDQRVNALAYAIEAGDKLQAFNALTEIGAHRWERHALSDIAALALSRPEPEVVTKACEVLQQLGSPRARIALAKASEGENPQSAALARNAMATLAPSPR